MEIKITLGQISRKLVTRMKHYFNLSFRLVLGRIRREKNWKIYTQCMPLDNFIAQLSTRMDSWMEILRNIYDPIQILQKNHHLQKGLSLVIALWADIFIAYIALNPVFTFFRQFYPGDLANFAVSTIIFFFIAALIIRWFG